MTEDARRPQDRDRDQSPEDKRLIGELDALYRRVASLDPPQVDRDGARPLVRDAAPEADGSWASTLTLPPSGPPPDPAVRDRAAASPSRTRTQTPPASPAGRRAGRFAAGALAGGALLCAVLFWPGLYHYEAIRLGDREYPVRINRLTTHVQYHNGRRWLDPPLRVTAPGPAPAPITPHPAPTPLISAVPPDVRGPATAPAAPEQRERRPAFPDRNAAGYGSGRPYAVQIGACLSLRKAESLAAGIRRREFPVRIEAASIGDRRWHRVLVGRFADRDTAERWLREHGFAEDYPDSFVQKSVRG